MSLVIAAPQADEYAPYYGRYISLVSGNDVLKTLRTESEKTLALLKNVTEAQAEVRYAPGKWSVKEVMGHMNDTERIFGYRALRISRNDRTPIEGYEQDDYIRFGPFAHCRLEDLREEFHEIRKATLRLLGFLDEDGWDRKGIANKNEMSVRAVAYVIAGHELHHRAILQDKYGIG